MATTDAKMGTDAVTCGSRHNTIQPYLLTESIFATAWLCGCRAKKLRCILQVMRLTVGGPHEACEDQAKAVAR